MKKNFLISFLLLTSSLTFAQTLIQSVYIDFGLPNGGTAAITESPDKNGNYWNNATSGALNATVSLKTATNVLTPYVLEITKAFKTNQTGAGGLSNPDENLLGDLAIGTATQDYFYVEGSNATFKIKNLDNTKAYKFHAFGSRAATSGTDVRTSQYTFSGLDQSSGSLQASGNGNGIGNTSNIFISTLVSPDNNGEISFELVNKVSNFGYINAMKIEEYTNNSVIPATSILLTGNNITASGQTSQITATVYPEGAIYPTIRWSVDNTAIAYIDNNGVVYPKTNGTITVTASITYSNDVIISGQTQIHISGQLGKVFFSGSASEEESAEMHMITNRDGMITNNFEIYTSLKGSGSFFFSRDDANGNKIEYGAGETPGTLLEEGEPVETNLSGAVRITINLTDKTYTILPITSLCVVGSSVAGGTDVTKGSPLAYQGMGIWYARLNLNGGDPKFNFIINKTAQECLKRISGSNQVISQSQGTQFEILMEDIRTNMNGGQFDITLNLRDYTYSVSCGDVNDYKISYMGSSVATGSGALSNLGWAYMYTNLLKQRYENALGLNWKTSNISIGGNTTADLLNRWERDLLSNCSRYVLYALSLGNEGIHERGEPAYISYRDGMLQAVKQAEDAGIIPVIANNYTRADFNANDYNYVKKLNLLIHEWDIPSINTLGAIDDGSGHWASGYENDNAHPNSAGHEEFYYAIVPSLFDALDAGKPLPVKVSGTSYKLGKNLTADRIEFSPENIVHSFTLSFDIQTTTGGTIIWFENESNNGFLKIDNEGKLVYESPKKKTIRSADFVATGAWNRITLTHYYARGITLLYINNVKAGELYEKLAPKKFALGGAGAPDEFECRELFFWRSGMNAEEIEYVNNGKMMKSSLEIYAPLGGTEPLVNLAQANNTLQLTNSSQILDQKIYLDFGATGGTSALTENTDTQRNYWNNIANDKSGLSTTPVGTRYNLVNSTHTATGYVLEITKGFKTNTGGAGGLTNPDENLLGDLAIGTATQDYFYVEGDNATFTVNNLDKNKMYKFHVFGSRSGTEVRTAQYTLTGTNESIGTLQTTGNGNGTGNTSNIFISPLIIPDSTGKINFKLENLVSNFGYLNAMKIEEYSTLYPEGESSLISVTPDDGTGVRITRIYSNTGGFTNEGAENLLLDKNIPANKNKKWCYNAPEHAVIFELSDFYNIDKFIIDDCKTRENNPNFPEYYIYASSAGTNDEDWVEIVHETNQSDVMYKIKEIAPVKARYIKFVPKGIDVIRIFGFQIYGRKSFDSFHPEELISVGKPVIEQQNSTNIQQAALALFDGNINAANSKWTAATGDKHVVIDLKDNYDIAEFKLYDAQSVSSADQNINGYKISIASDLSNWETLVDANDKGTENIKTEIISPEKTARYVKLEIPENRMGSEKKINLYEFEIYGNLTTTSGDTNLSKLNILEGRLFPDFNPARTNYSLNVAKEIDKITIQAAARNENATLDGDLGEKTLQPGNNNFFITVTAADLSTAKTYCLTVNRAKKSTLAGLKSLSINDAELFPAFSPANTAYRVEVKSETLTILAEATSPDAIITGNGERSLHEGVNYLTLSITSEDEQNTCAYTIAVYNTSNLISVSSADGKGKRIVNIDSYSGMSNLSENPFRLLRGWRDNLSGEHTMKWCDLSEQPWIIFSLVDIYTINRIEFRDCRMVESNWPNVPQYSVYVSTTDTLPESWTEIINESGVADVNEKVKSFDPVNARFVKFVPAKEGNAIRIYGFDIYGILNDTIDRNGRINAGKTIVDYSACTNDMLTPANILDGRSGTSWEFSRAAAYVIVDLEKTYTVGKFAVVDSPDWINGYKISVGNSVNDTDWEEIVDVTFDDYTIERKEVVLNQAKQARYVRLDILRANQLGTNHIKEFEIYSYVENTGLDAGKNLSSDQLIIYPNPVARGENIYIDEKGSVKIYSLQGILVYQQDIKDIPFISTANLLPGSYIIQLTNNKNIKQAR
jgi:lysophospholipase L1-like esterase